MKGVRVVLAPDDAQVVGKCTSREGVTDAQGRIDFGPAPYPGSFIGSAWRAGSKTPVEIRTATGHAFTVVTLPELN